MPNKWLLHGVGASDRIKHGFDMGSVSDQRSAQPQQIGSNLEALQFLILITVKLSLKYYENGVSTLRTLPNSYDLKYASINHTTINWSK